MSQTNPTPLCSLGRSNGHAMQYPGTIAAGGLSGGSLACPIPALELQLRAHTPACSPWQCQEVSAACCCRRESILGIARSRTGWLVAFCVGLLLAAVVVEQFEDVLEHHVSEQRHGRDDHRQAGNDAVAVCCYTLLRTNSVGGQACMYGKTRKCCCCLHPGHACHSRVLQWAASHTTG